MSTGNFQSFSPVELAWIRTETPENLSLHTVALVCEGRLELSCLKSRIEDRLLSEQRLRQRIGSSHLPLARPRWEEHERFQLSDHFFRVDATSGEPVATLAGLIGRLTSQGLDHRLPLWQIHLVELEQETSAVVFRLHAAVADGAAAAALALRLIDAEDPPPLTELGFEHQIPLQPALDRAGSSAAATRALCQLITCRADRDSPFRASPTGSKAIAWSEPVDLGTTRAQKPKGDFSSTEALVAAVVAGLRKAVQRQNIPAEDMDLRAVVHLDLRQPEDPAVGTRSALGLIRLPLRAATHAERAEEIHRELERFAHVPEDLVVLGCEAGLGLTMSEIEERSLRLLGDKATASLAILDGPTQRQKLCGQTVLELRWMPATTGDNALGISLVSYADQMRFGVTCDEALDLDAALLVAEMATAAAQT